MWLGCSRCSQKSLQMGSRRLKCPLSSAVASVPIFRQPPKGKGCGSWNTKNFARKRCSNFQHQMWAWWKYLAGLELKNDRGRIWGYQLPMADDCESSLGVSSSFRPQMEPSSESWGCAAEMTRSERARHNVTRVCREIKELEKVVKRTTYSFFT